MLTISLQVMENVKANTPERPLIRISSTFVSLTFV